MKTLINYITERFKLSSKNAVIKDLNNDIFLDVNYVKDNFVDILKLLFPIENNEQNWKDIKLCVNEEDEYSSNRSIYLYCNKYLFIEFDFYNSKCTGIAINSFNPNIPYETRRKSDLHYLHFNAEFDTIIDKLNEDSIILKIGNIMKAVRKYHIPIETGDEYIPNNWAIAKNDKPYKDEYYDMLKKNNLYK